MRSMNTNHNHNPNPQEKFELLSAYIDNEVSASEKRQVEQWLATDPDFRRLYQQQLRLREFLVNLPVPEKVNSDLFVNRVMAKIDKRSQNRKIVWGGIAIIAALFGAVGSITFRSPSEPNFAINSIPPQGEYGKQQVAFAPIGSVEEPLIINMEEPIVPLPKTNK